MLTRKFYGERRELCPDAPPLGLGGDLERGDERLAHLVVRRRGHEPGDVVLGLVPGVPGSLGVILEFSRNNRGPFCNLWAGRVTGGEEPSATTTAVPQIMKTQMPTSQTRFAQRLALT